MQYARVAGGIVAELIEIDAEGLPLGDRFHPDIVAACIEVVDPGEVAPGWLWDGASFLPPTAPVPPVPDISARQLRLWLLSQGIALSAVEDAIAALPAGAQPAARVEWEYATVFQRAHPLIAQLAPALGLASEAAIDAAFIDASTR